MLLTGCAAPKEQTVTIQETEYPISTTRLDLSGTPLEDIRQLFSLTQLRELDLRDTGISPAEFQALQEALPQCHIHWSVPFQGKLLDSETQSLRLSALAEEDFEMLAFFPNLREVNLGYVREAAAVLRLREQYPEFSVTYRILLGSAAVLPSQETVSAHNVDPAQLVAILPLLPELKEIRLVGQLPEPAALLELMEQYPDIRFSGNPVLGGIVTDLSAEKLDLTGAQLESVEELYRWLPCYPSLNWVELGDSTLENQELDLLNKSFRDIVVAWNVSIGPIRVSTAITHFMPYQYGYINLPTSAFQNLRYCTRIKMIDMGHCELRNVDFVEYMPDLEFLLLCENRITDAEAISKCKNLRYLELFLTGVTDFYPMLNLTELEDLNLSYDGCPQKDVYVFPEDLTPLYQMPWLHRLWMPLNGMYPDEQAEVRSMLPGTTVVFPRRGSTACGWRYCPSYYAQRDILGYFYMYK